MNSTKQIKNLLADQLGLDTEDIATDDSLTIDLHMQATDITDFIATLEENGYDTSKLDLAETETLADLFEALNLEDPNQ